jgi:hypothetical protein
MPLPKKRKDQDPKKFLSSCMSNPTMKKEYPDQKQRVAICISQSKSGNLLAQADMHMLYENSYWDDEWNEFTYDIAEGNTIYDDDRESIVLTADKDLKGKKLNKPFRTPSGPKKFSVYVKNDKGNIVKVNFGDPDMEIKRDDPERRKSYRARHGCDGGAGPKWKANYWSCKMWSNNKVSDLT